MKKIVLGLMFLGSIMFGSEGVKYEKIGIEAYYNEYVPLLLDCESKYFENTNLDFSNGLEILVFFAKAQRACFKYVEVKHKMNFIKDIVKPIGFINKELYDLLLDMFDEVRAEFIPIYPLFPSYYVEMPYVGDIYKNDDEAREAFRRKKERELKDNKK